MTEADFWIDLEYRTCGEFGGMPERYLQYLWCDGFTPTDYLLDAPCPCIRGLVWNCNGPKQKQWEFTLFLGQPVGSRAEID
jgi:hypothetical protein